VTAIALIPGTSPESPPLGAIPKLNAQLETPGFINVLIIFVSQESGSKVSA
jgi:hypothetical protein